MTRVHQNDTFSIHETCGATYLSGHELSENMWVVYRCNETHDRGGEYKPTAKVNTMPLLV